MDFLKMPGVDKALSQKKKITLRYELKPGDIGYITYLHGILHAREDNWNHEFEGYVAEGLGRFAISHDSVRDRLWMAELDGKIVGCVAVVGNMDTEAQLRWFLVHPSLRGHGLGTKLLNKAMQFCKDCGYTNVILWTTSNLEAAAHLYTKSGFIKTETKTNEIWGHKITQEKYERSLELMD